MLKLHKEQQQSERQAAGVNWKGTSLVFTSTRGGPVETANLSRHFNRLLDRAGLCRIRFHDLRHSTATLLLEQGVELVVIKALLGHAHIGVTATVYAYVIHRLQRDIIGTALGRAEVTEKANADSNEPPPCSVAVKYQRSPARLRLTGLRFAMGTSPNPALLPQCEIDA